MLMKAGDDNDDLHCNSPTVYCHDNFTCKWRYVAVLCVLPFELIENWSSTD